MCRLMFLFFIHLLKAGIPLYTHSDWLIKILLQHLDSVLIDIVGDSLFKSVAWLIYTMHDSACEIAGRTHLTFIVKRFMRASDGSNDTRLHNPSQRNEFFLWVP